MHVSVHNLLKKFRQLLPFLLIGGGLLLLFTSGIHSTWRDRSLRLREEQVPSIVENAHTNKSSPLKIYIPWRVDVAVNSGQLKDGKWSIDQDKATHLTQSAFPGDPGNIVIYGHNTREILGNIRVLVPGEKISLFSSDNTEYTYEVEWTQEVSPHDTQALQQTDSEVLTLFTCSGFLDSKRFIVRAKRI